MQHKLATWAESDPNRRFDRLLRLIANREWLAEAARMVLASSGARTPGIDGMDKQRLQVKLDQHLEDLRASLLDESYRPQSVKRIYIPKSNGKLRPLGIPTPDGSHRPTRHADGHGANLGKRFPSFILWLPTGTQCTSCRPHREDTATGWSRYDEGPLDHRRRSRQLLRHGPSSATPEMRRRRVKDGRFVDLLWQFLKAGHIDRDLFTASSEGVPQGWRSVTAPVQHHAPRV